MNRDELNEIYRELENRMHRIVAPFTLLHKGLIFHVDITVYIITRMRKENT